MSAYIVLLVLNLAAGLQEDADVYALGSALHREALALRGEGRFKEAERKSLQSIALLEKHFGAGSDKLATPLLNLAATYLDTGQTSKAENTLTRVMTWIEDFPPTSEVKARTYQSLAAVHSLRGEIELALTFDKLALEIMVLRYGSEHLEVAVQEANMALSLVTTGRASEAAPILERSLRKAENAIDAHSPLLLHFLIPMVLAYDSNTSKATAVLERSLGIVAASYGVKHNLRGLLLARYAELLRRKGSKDAAKRASNESRKILKDYGRHTVDINDLIKASRSPR